MESCRFPIELCEAVMNALPDCYEYLGRPPEVLSSFSTWRSQQALCACALTCRAWRVRAQHLLSTSPHIFNDTRLARFTTTVQKSPNITIAGLTLGDFYRQSRHLDSSRASWLFMHPYLRLQHLRCINVDFDRGPPLRILRMRLPFFASITTLRLWYCTFQSLRAMLAVVWACPNLAVLNIRDTSFTAGRRSSVAALRQMSATVEHLKACRKLTSLHVDRHTLLAAWDCDSAGLSGVGGIFGCAITELYFVGKPDSCKIFGSLLRGSFPALHSVTVISESGLWWPGDDDRSRPWLHIIAIGRPIPGRLKTIFLQQHHQDQTGYDRDCCKRAVGTSEEVVGSEKRLPELLAGLERLTIRFERCKDPGRCVAYVRSVLLGMQDILQFEYRPPTTYAWIPY